MLRVKTRVGVSAIHGLGLFADEFIPQGTIVWDFDPGFDHRLPIEAVRERAAKDPIFAAFARRAGYEEKHTPNFIIFDFDDGRFMNDSTEPTCYLSGLQSIAARDIHPGEELTERYEDFLIDNETAVAIRWRMRG